MKTDLRNTRICQRLFIKFLMRRHAYCGYITARRKDRYKNYLEPPIDVFMTKEIECWVFYAFTWSETQEGWRYWSKIDKEWKHICKS